MMGGRPNCIQTNSNTIYFLPGLALIFACLVYYSCPLRFQVD